MAAAGASRGRSSAAGGGGETSAAAAAVPLATCPPLATPLAACWPLGRPSSAAMALAVRKEWRRRQAWRRGAGGLAGGLAGGGGRRPRREGFRWSVARCSQLTKPYLQAGEAVRGAGSWEAPLVGRFTGQTEADGSCQSSEWSAAGLGAGRGSGVRRAVAAPAQQGSGQSTLCATHLHEPGSTLRFAHAHLFRRNHKKRCSAARDNAESRISPSGVAPHSGCHGREPWCAGEAAGSAQAVTASVQAWRRGCKGPAAAGGEGHRDGLLRLP